MAVSRWKDLHSVICMLPSQSSLAAGKMNEGLTSRDHW